MSMKNDAAVEREMLDSAVKMFWNPNGNVLNRSWLLPFLSPVSRSMLGWV